MKNNDLILQKLSKSYHGQVVFSDLSLALSPGNAYCLMAPSGTGKTTLFRILRRLSLLRALLVPFDFLILDEPFNGLDSENRKKAAALVRNHAQNKILLFAAHTKEDAALLGAEILCPFDSYCSV